MYGIVIGKLLYLTNRSEVKINTTGNFLKKKSAFEFVVKWHM